jgi:hypothetical protein
MSKSASRIVRRASAFPFVIAIGVVAACGSRTGLLVDESFSQTKSALFCLHAEYASGRGDVGLYVMLDDSGSMNDDQKWDLATAALSAFVDDPRAAGIEIGLQYLPLGSSCDAEEFARPAVPLAALPGNAAPIKRSLAQHTPDGATPLLPALEGGITYARARMQADATRAVVVALVTDGTPDACDSTTASVASVATAGLSADPQVLTFVIGLETGEVPALDRIAAAGGTGKAILIGRDPNSAQSIVDTLRTLRDSARLCRYGVPASSAAHPSAGDLTVTYRTSPSASPTALSIVASANDCGASGAFFANDGAHPTLVTLCPSACSVLHANPASRVTVTAGCGLGAPDGGGAPDKDGGTFCSGINSVYCVPSCGSSDTSTPPVCVAGEWTCPSGTISLDECARCPPVPHGCCKGDGTLARASCVNRAWVCPPGATSFGSPGCSPPEVCATLMPCGAGQYCKVPDFTCGDGNTPGACATIPNGCASGGPPVCGCDGLNHVSACDAASGAIDLSASGACTEPPATFACGPLFCRVADQICRSTNDLAKLVAPRDYACLDASPACPTGCGCGACGPCPAGRSCKESCATGSTGGRVLNCARL